MTSAELSKLQQTGLTEIKTPQELVHIRHKITLLQYKYWILMLRTYRELYEEGKRFGEEDFCYLSMEGVKESIGYLPKLQEFRDDLEKLRQEAIIFNILEKDGEKAQQGQGFISEWKLSSSRVGVRFPVALRRAVENLSDKKSIFHLLNWQVFNSLSGKYEAILYKLCKDYVGTGRTRKFSVELYREYMGIAPEEYADFKRLNQWCISGPAKKINASPVCDITVEPKFERESRRVVSIQFLVQQKRQTVLDFGEDPVFSQARIRISPAKQKEYLANKDPEIIGYSIRRANEYADEKEKKGEEVDIGKVYAKAISEDWGIEYKSKLEAAEKKAETAKKRKSSEAEKAGEAKLRDEFRKEWEARAEAALAGLGDEDETRLFERWKFEENPVPAIYAKRGKATVMFRVWARQQLLPKPDEEGFATWLRERGANG